MRARAVGETNSSYITILLNINRCLRLNFRRPLESGFRSYTRTEEGASGEGDHVQKPNSGLIVEARGSFPVREKAK